MLFLDLSFISGLSLFCCATLPFLPTSLLLSACLLGLSARRSFTLLPLKGRSHILPGTRRPWVSPSRGIRPYLTRCETDCPTSCNPHAIAISRDPRISKLNQFILEHITAPVKATMAPTNQGPISPLYPPEARRKSSALKTWWHAFTHRKDSKDSAHDEGEETALHRLPYRKPPLSNTTS